MKTAITNLTKITAALFFAASAAHGQIITVPNASFESPSSPAQTSKSPNIIPGWVFDVQGNSQYGTMTTHSANFTSSGTSSGNNYATINNDYPGVTDTLTSAESLGTITPVTQYTLTVAIGNRVGTGLYDDPGNVTINLLANGVPFATQEITNGTVPNGTFEDFSLTYTTSNSDSIIGESLEIQMTTLPEESNAYQAGFDNVRLDASPVIAAPEPTTWVLLASGILALGWLKRWQRSPNPL